MGGGAPKRSEKSSQNGLPIVDFSASSPRAQPFGTIWHWSSVFTLTELPNFLRSQSVFTRWSDPFGYDHLRTVGAPSGILRFSLFARSSGPIGKGDSSLI